MQQMVNINKFNRKNKTFHASKVIESLFLQHLQFRLYKALEMKREKIKFKITAQKPSQKDLPFIKKDKMNNTKFSVSYISRRLLLAKNCPFPNCAQNSQTNGIPDLQILSTTKRASKHSVSSPHYANRPK